MPIALPHHIAIIMDGNGRWANRRYLPRIEGHRKGSQTSQKIIKAAYDTDITYLSLFTLSSENMQRPKSEIENLILLFEEHLKRTEQETDDKHIRWRFIGDLSFLSPETRQKIDALEEKSAHYERMTVQIMLNYSGKNDILHASQNILRRALENKTKPEDITPAFFEEHLMLRDSPPVDLLIRTAGDQRISNFMLWHLAYSELFFTDLYWPDFTQATFHDALTQYRKRDRRFGLIDKEEYSPALLKVTMGEK